MLGFFIGILYANIVSKQLITSTGIFSEYFLSQYVETEIIMEDYLPYILKIRVFPLLLLLLLGTTKARKPAVAGFIGWTGFSSGMLMVAAIMQMGMRGIALCAIGIAPQFFFYVFAYVIALWYLYMYPVSRWNVGKTVFVLMGLSMGVLLEVYVNPILMKMFLMKIGRF